MRSRPALGLALFACLFGSWNAPVWADPSPSQAEIIARQRPVPDYLLLLNTVYPVWIAWGQPEQFRLFDVQRIWLPTLERIEGAWQYRVIYRLEGGRSLLLASHPSEDLRPDDRVLARAVLPSGEPIVLYQTATGLRSSVWGRYPGYYFQSPAPETPGLPNPGSEPVSLQEALEFVACLRLMDRQTLVP